MLNWENTALGAHMNEPVVVPLGRKAARGTLAVETGRFTGPINEYIYTYGLRQIINDAMATKKGEDGEALPDDVIVAKAQKRLDALYAGTVRMRYADDAEPLDPIEAELHKIVKKAAHDTMTKVGAYAHVPKGTKNRLLAAFNWRRVATHKTPVDDDVGMVAALIEASPMAATWRQWAIRNVAESETAAGGIVV